MKLSYYLPTKIFMDDDCVTKHAEALKCLGKTALIVTGAHSAKKNGSLDDLCKALADNGQTWVVFDKVMSNPTVDCVYEGAALAKEGKADFVVAIGGGSPMDASKAIAMLACTDISKEHIFGGGYDKRLPLCCIPTTAGTGSEVTQYAILTNDAAQTKTSLASPTLFPDLALLDSKYLKNLSKNVMTNTVIDSLSHSVEGFISNRANPMSDTLALEAISIISGLIPSIAEWRLTDEDRAKLLYASTLSGMVIAHTGTTIVHSMGYCLTYFHNIDHGRANGLLLGEYLSYTEKERADRIDPILKAASMNSVAEFKAAMAALLGECEKFTQDEIEKYSAIAIKAKNVANCIVKPTEEVIKTLYMLSLGLK